MQSNSNTDDEVKFLQELYRTPMTVRGTFWNIEYTDIKFIPPSFLRGLVNMKHQVTHAKATKAGR